MTEYSNENRGAVWKNEKKSTENHPDFTGSLNVEGVEYWVSAWRRKEGANPKSPALSFSIKAKDAPQQAAPQQQAAPASGGGFEDDIPFNSYEKRMVI